MSTKPILICDAYSLSTEGRQISGALRSSAWAVMRMCEGDIRLDAEALAAVMSVDQLAEFLLPILPRNMQHRHPALQSEYGVRATTEAMFQASLNAVVTLNSEALLHLEMIKDADPDCTISIVCNSTAQKQRLMCCGAWKIVPWEHVFVAALYGSALLQAQQKLGFNIDYTAVVCCDLGTVLTARAMEISDLVWLHGSGTDQIFNPESGNYSAGIAVARNWGEVTKCLEDLGAYHPKHEPSWRHAA